jgi:putative transposase
VDFLKGKGGTKTAVKLDRQGKIPCFAVVPNARGHDAKKTREIPYESGDALVFDRGFADYGYFEEICGKKACFATRLEKNAAYRHVGRREIKEGGEAYTDLL